MEKTCTYYYVCTKMCLGTGKSFSEALILASVNPQYDKILFIDFPKKYKFTTCSEKDLPVHRTTYYVTTVVVLVQYPKVEIKLAR